MPVQIQIAVIPGLEDPSIVTVVKVLMFAEKISKELFLTVAQGVPYHVDFGFNHRSGFKAFQLLFELLGGLQLRVGALQLPGPKKQKPTKQQPKKQKPKRKRANKRPKTKSKPNSQASPGPKKRKPERQSQEAKAKSTRATTQTKK